MCVLRRCMSCRAVACRSCDMTARTRRRLGAEFWLSFCREPLSVPPARIGRAAARRSDPTPTRCRRGAEAGGVGCARSVGGVPRGAVAAGRPRGAAGRRRAAPSDRLQRAARPGLTCHGPAWPVSMACGKAARPAGMQALDAAWTNRSGAGDLSVSISTSTSPSLSRNAGRLAPPRHVEGVGAGNPLAWRCLPAWRAAGAGTMASA